MLVRLSSWKGALLQYCYSRSGNGLHSLAGEDFPPAPDLDHANADLREGLKHWLQVRHLGCLPMLLMLLMSFKHKL